MSDNKLSKYNPQRLLQLWVQNKVTQLQAMGHVLQNLHLIQQQISDILTLLHYYDRDLALLYEHLGLDRPSRKMKPPPPPSEEADDSSSDGSSDDEEE